MTGKGLAANIKAAFPPVVLHGVVLLLLDRQHAQHRRRRRRHGRGRASWSPGSTATSMTVVFVLGTLGPADLRALSPLRRLPEMADPVAAGLCGGAVHGACAWGQVALRTRLAEVHAGRRLPRRWWSAVFGTTISPYLFFWQASEEVEDMQASTARAAAARSGRPQPESCAASAGTPGAACSTPTSRPISSSWRPP